ncbi:unnamed protein product [Blepharisma stoltei]|uniref:Uncharacterized protein n=1 Tax=Blepharisma stoltei TaxID=1481888 RepID=A0AAU9IKB1_9CILI|nr:unnamed protein product [Blepharisma stoltei]
MIYNLNNKDNSIPLKQRINNQREKLMNKHLNTMKLENLAGIYKVHEATPREKSIETLFGISKSYTCSERLIHLSKPRDPRMKKSKTYFSQTSLQVTKSIFPQISKPKSNSEVLKIYQELDKFTERIKNDSTVFGCSTIDIMNLKSKKYRKSSVS